MPQVIVKVTPEKFMHALNFARRTDPRVNASCANESTIMLRCAGEFHRLYPDSKDPVAHRRRDKRRRNEVEFYSRRCHHRLAMEGNVVRGGFTVMDGELMGLWNTERGRGDWMMREALSLGADRLDYFDLPALATLYTRHGFVEVLREPNHTAGQPDVVWSRLKEEN